MLDRLQHGFFAWMLMLSLALHGLAAVWFGAVGLEAPKLISPQTGKASIRLLASESSRPRDDKQNLQKLLDDLPPPTTPKDLLEPPLPHKEEAIARPRLIERPTPPLLDTHANLPPEVPDLPAPLPMKTVLPPREEQNIPRPTAKLETLPKLEAVTRVAELAKAPSQPSEASQGVVDELPQKSPLNPGFSYPHTWADAGQHGTVLLRVKIDADGKVTAISLYESSGYANLDNSALSTVRRWLFIPARRGGRPVPYEVLVPVIFYDPRYP